MITLFDEFLLERKQLGTIYHFTQSLWMLSCILEEDVLKIGGGFEGISFTRNKNMWDIKYMSIDDSIRYKIRISFDGDRMSDKWKFEPFLYDGDFDFKGEAEERVLMDKMVGIRKYITKITFRRQSLVKGDLIKIRNLKKEYPEIKFEIIDNRISEGQQYLSDVEFKEEQDEDRIKITAYKSNDEKVGRVILELNSGAYWYFEDDFTQDEYDEMFPDDEFMKIEHIEVRDKKSGVARKLMSLAIEKSKELGYHQIYLNASPIHSENMLQLQDLIWFYKTFGFKEILHQGNNCQMLLNI